MQSYDLGPGSRGGYGERWGNYRVKAKDRGTQFNNFTIAMHFLCNERAASTLPPGLPGSSPGIYAHPHYAGGFFP